MVSAYSSFRQDLQVKKSALYNDDLGAGSTLQSGATNLQDDLNGIRSQLNRILNATGAGNWYDDITSIGGSQRSLVQLATDLLDVEQKKLLFRAQVLTDVSVTAAQNWEVLNVASSEAPSEVAAVGAGTANGAVVAVLAGDVGSHALTEVAGQNALNPKNLVIVRDATSGDPLLSGGKQIYGLIQAETGTLDGEAFNDTTKQVQISFVIENATADDLIACPVVDIAGKTINYSYVRRINLDAVPEQAFLTGAFVDQSSSVDVTLDNAIDNQGTTPASQTGHTYWRITDDKVLSFQTSDGGVVLFEIAPAAAADQIVANATITNSQAFVSDQGSDLRAEYAGDHIYADKGFILQSGNVGVGAMLFDSMTGAIQFKDVYESTSGWTADRVDLASSDDEWDAYKAAFGEVSLFNAITQAGVDTSLDKAVDKQIALAAPVTQANDVAWEITDSKGLRFQTSGGGVNLLAILPGAAGDEIEFNVDTFDVNNALDANFLNGAIFDSGGTSINVGVTAGQIDAAANLTISATGAGSDLHLVAADLMDFTDGYYAASGYDTPLVLSDSSAEWNAFETAFGEVSLLNAIVAAKTANARNKVTAVVTAATIAKDANVTGSGGSPNVDAVLPSYNGLTFVSAVDVYLNSGLMRGGATSGADFDTYPGTSAGTGDLKFEFDLTLGDVITVIVHGTPTP